MQTSHPDDQAIQILSNEGAQCGNCGDEPGDRLCLDCEQCRLRYVAALRAAGWAPQGEIKEQLAAVTEELAAIKKDLAHLEAALRTSTEGETDR